MAVDQIGTKGLVDCSVAAADIADGTITNAKLAGSIANAKLANSSITVNGQSISLGASGAVPAVDWQSVVVSDGSTVTTMVAGRGYFVNNTSAAGIVKLPASASAGDFISIKDYAGNFGTNNLTIQRNSHNIQGVANDSLISTNRASVSLVYVDATKGWLYTNESNVGNLGNFTQATGGTVTTTGNFKVHTFTGDGTFAVTNVGFGNNVDYLVVAGGGGAGAGPGGNTSGGGGGGGFRQSSGTSHGCYTVSPLGSGVSALTITAQNYPITVGGGGSGSSCNSTKGSSGSNSVFSTITSAGGGGGGSNGSRPGVNGGSGGGGSGGALCQSGGSGNTPPVSPPQGSNGGQSTAAPATNDVAGGGGGGATEVGANASSPGTSGPAGRGGAGASTAISGSSLAYSGGGGAGGSPNTGIGAASPCGTGGAGSNFYSPDKTHNDGTTNRGGGGGGIGGCSCGGAGGEGGGDGGSGVVVIRYRFQ